MTVSIVLLAHNEAEVIAEEIAAFHQSILRDLPEAELVVAEDGSRDGTRDRIEEASRDFPLRLVGSRERLGYTGAVVGVLRTVDTNWVLLCDSGLKHDPRDFWRLWKDRHRYDVVLGRRTDRQDQWYRRFLTVAFNLFIRCLFPIHLHDCDTGMRLLRRPVIDLVVSRGLTFRGFASTEVVLRAAAAGFRCGEVPVAYRQRSGESRGLPLRNAPRAIFRGIVDLARLRRELRSR